MQKQGGAGKKEQLKLEDVKKNKGLAKLLVLLAKAKKEKDAKDAAAAQPKTLQSDGSLAGVPEPPKAAAPNGTAQAPAAVATEEDGAEAGAGVGGEGEALDASEALPRMGLEQIMAQKAHGTCDRPVQRDLMYGCDRHLADQICCFNRHGAENAYYFCGKNTSWRNDVTGERRETTYFDSVTGKPLFVAPRGRSFDAFKEESESHGWPSFRDAEVNWDYVRCLEGAAICPPSLLPSSHSVLPRRLASLDRLSLL